ncbi:MAG: hypothetical protein ACRD0A_17455 [Acidimicrobiales bacterium]
MNDDRAREAVDHLQVAVRELIAAGQALLAAFDDVVDRPEAGDNLLAAFESVAKRFLPSEGWDDEADKHDQDGDDGDDGEGGGGGFEPIRID